MSSSNIIFSKLEKFTGNGDINLHQWLCNFDRCCVIAKKSDDLLVGQILMLCIDGRAKAILGQFEDEKGSPKNLQNLPLQGHTGPDLLDANGQIMKPFGVIKATFVVGHPAVSHIVEFMIIDTLPYSCILGLSFLNKFTKWGIDNSKKLLHLDQSVVLVSSQPSLQDNIAFMTRNKYTILP